MDEVTRRRLLTGGIATVTLGTLGLGACDSPTPTSSSPDPETSSRTITTAKGDVTVPTDPQRVVCLDPGFSWQTLLEVGVTPVGVPSRVDSLILPHNLAAIAGVPTVLEPNGEPDLEKIASLHPDLILASSGPVIDKNYAKLTTIAPTAVYAFDYPSDWEDLDRAYANAVNRATKLSGVIAAYEGRLTRLKSDHGATIAAQRWALVTESDKQVYVWGSRSSAGPVLTAAGAAFSVGAPGNHSPFTQISAENLNTIADATVILYGAGADTRPYLETSQLLDNPVFTTLPAVRAGHVYPLPSWFAYCYQDADAQLDGIAAACQKLEASK
ncbi:MAG: iron-siderophore ABC transporter substrate-binding protein [Nocardioides sp.]